VSCISSPPRSSGALDFNELSQIARGPVADCPCPLCGPAARAPHNKTRKVLRVWQHDDHFLTYKCQRCGASGWARDGRTGSGPSVQPREPAKAPAATTPPEKDNIETAQWLWRHAQPARGTLVQRYLEARGCWVDSNTLRLLPARNDHPPAMIAAFGLPDEPEPGVLEIATSAVRGIHITRLAADGSGKAGTDKDKILLGPSSGWPIVLAPANDLLGICIGEGIEKTAAYHRATGLGAWVAGAAGRMPALVNVLPSYIEHVDVLADDDFAGQKSARELANKLDARRIRHRVVTRSGAAHE
jgi:Toprim domain